MLDNIMKFTYFKASINKYTFKVPKIKEWVEDHCRGKHILNLFAGPTRLHGCIEYSNDIDETIPSSSHMDALDYVNLMINNDVKFDIILLDPPYSYRKSMEFYNGHKNSRFKQILDLLPSILKEDGKIITFGYHASQMGKSREFKLDELLIVDHSGAIHTTLSCVESRINQ